LPRISPATKAKPSILNPGKAVSASPTPKAVAKR
jgi:penicillin-binding protein 2